MKFRKFKKQDIRQVAKVKDSVFRKFNRFECFEKNAVERYLSRTNLKQTDSELIEAFRISRQSIFYVAEEKNKIIGYIKGDKNNIKNLFVLGEAHKKGIGKGLVALFEKEAIKQNSNKIKITASIYATPFYQKMGYKKTTGIRNWHGLKTQPMKKILN